MFNGQLIRGDIWLEARGSEGGSNFLSASDSGAQSELLIIHNNAEQQQAQKESKTENRPDRASKARQSPHSPGIVAALTQSQNVWRLLSNCKRIETTKRMKCFHRPHTGRGGEG